MDPMAPPGSELETLAVEIEALGHGWDDDELAHADELRTTNRLATVGTLTAGMAHELGTPLGVVLARAQMIVTDGDDLADARSDAKEIIAQVNRMTKMCREVLDFARPKPPTRDRVDLVQLLGQMIALLGPDARSRGAKLVLVNQLQRAIVLGDPSKLLQIFTNLTINAAQAMPNGGTVTFTVTQQKLPDADYLCIGVHDTGTGIRRADLPRIFDAFFTTKKSEGTGLGLAVSSRIAREHDGWIGVASEPGHGSTFTVYLPPFAPPSA